jgi:hypothetical protein
MSDFTKIIPTMIGAALALIAGSPGTTERPA